MRMHENQFLLSEVEIYWNLLNNVYHASSVTLKH